MHFIKVKFFFDVLLDPEGRGCTKLTEGNTGSCDATEASFDWRDPSERPFWLPLSGDDSDIQPIEGTPL